MKKCLVEPAKNAPAYLKRIFGKTMTGNTWMGVISFTYVFAMSTSNMRCSTKLSDTGVGKVLQDDSDHCLFVIVNKTKYTMLEYANHC